MRRDYDAHGPAGPTLFWKAADAVDPRRALLNGISGFVVQPGWAEGVLVGLGSSEDELEFMDDDDVEEEWENDAEPISNELPGLLQDAEMDVVDVAYNVGDT